jgi:hypothetical protein
MGNAFNEEVKNEYRKSEKNLMMKLQEVELAKIEVEYHYKRMVELCEHEYKGRIIKTCKHCGYTYNILSGERK